jgi:glycosyltransferase involved in cell wall biosynthesis
MNAAVSPKRPVRVAMLATDAREHWREYGKTQPYFGTAPAALLDGLALLPDQVEVDVVCCIQKPMSSPQKLAENISFHTLLVPKIGWMRTAYQGCIRAVRRELRRLRPDIVHAQGTERDCAMCGIFSGFPNILTIHGNYRLIAKLTRAKPFSYPWLAAHLERFVLPRTAGVVCITKYTQDAVRPLAGRTWIIPNAVDSSFFEVQSAPSMPATILCVAHVDVRKNQVEFIRALDPLAAKRTFRVLFLGGAPAENPYCAQFFECIKSRPWCVYGGVADRAELKNHFRAASLLVLPSLEDNCPMVVLEAMAAGLPVAAANVGGVPELIEDRVTGLLFDPANPLSIRTTVAEALDEYEQARHRATTAREHARQRHHPRVIAERHLDIYRELLRMPA